MTTKEARAKILIDHLGYLPSDDNQRKMESAMEQYAREKAIEFRMWDYHKHGMDVNELKKTCTHFYDEYENNQQ